jgi:hypothetical protein
MRMSWIKDALKLVLVNLGVLVFFLALLLFVPALWVDAKKGLRQNVDAVAASSRASLPAYDADELPMIERHFVETNRMRTRYYDFIGWRRTAFQGDAITIDEAGYRRHPSVADGPEQAQVWLFGGSTMWGSGAHDAATIPALLEKVSGKSVFNFGETAYVAHQSLNLMMRQYILGGSPELVVFYDGVNEVLHKCRRELGFFSTSREQQIRTRMGTEGSQFLKLFAPLVESIAKGLAKTSMASVDENSMYDCHSDEQKVELIARTLVADWQAAKLLAAQQGAEFLGVLQPVSYIGEADVSYLPGRERNPALGRQYEAVYPRVRALLDEAGMSYLDLSDVFTAEDQVYIDFCHLSPRGNAIIARQLGSHIMPSGRPESSPSSL